MARLRYNGLVATLGGTGLTASATSVTFAATLTHSGGVAVPTIAGTDYIVLTILDSSSVVSEVVYLTAYTSGGTTGTISRAQEGTSGVTHAAGDKVVHGPTVADVAVESTWTAPTLTNGWVNFGAPYANVGYRKDPDGRVTLRGLIKLGTLGQSAFTLPSAYRPPANVIMAVISNDAFGEVIIGSDGTVKPTSPSSTSWVSLSGIAFFID